MDDVIHAFSLAAQVGGVIPIALNGQALVIIWMDRRAGTLWEHARQYLGDEQIFRLR